MEFTMRLAIIFLRFSTLVWMAPVWASPNVMTPDANLANTFSECPLPGDIPESAMMSSDALWERTLHMASYNFRHAGSPTHQRYLNSVEAQFNAYGLSVKRYPTPLKYWEAKRWSLRVKDSHGRVHIVPVAYYRPYSGETPAKGVTATVVDVRTGQAADYENTDVKGKIVLADLTIPKVTTAVLAPLTLFSKDPAPEDEDYSRMPSQGIAPDLALARQHGAVAMINIIDRSPAEVSGQFYPHQQHYVGLPALHLDRIQGAKLRALMAAGPITAKLVLTAIKKDSEVDYLAAELPGNGSLEGAILVLTHSDGQNAVEENGVPAVMSMVEYFSRLPLKCRPRDILFLLSGTHMVSSEGAVHSDTFLKEHPEIKNRIKAALAPEHLGTMNWTEDKTTGAYAPTGQSELAIVGVGNSQGLTRLAIDAVASSDLSRTYVLAPYKDLYGEGTGPYRAGIPTITFITGPSYLVQVAPHANIDKLDQALMHRQMVWLNRLLSRMLNMPDDML